MMIKKVEEHVVITWAIEKIGNGKYEKKDTKHGGQEQGSRLGVALGGFLFAHHDFTIAIVLPDGRDDTAFDANQLGGCEDLSVVWENIDTLINGYKKIKNKNSLDFSIKKI